MGYKIKVENPGYDEGAELTVVGLPPLQVGKWVEIDDDAEAFFEAETGMKLKEAFKGSENITLESTSSTKKGE